MISVQSAAWPTIHNLKYGLNAMSANYGITMCVRGCYNKKMESLSFALPVEENVSISDCLIIVENLPPLGKLHVIKPKPVQPGEEANGVQVCFICIALIR